ncbi:hypothetical protein Taro_017051 [Colocasia esculenta]|uniref:Uncharacterized protein n=1 Tax=Colocasia esculenta TaxID=4460 RepID=A0A843US30_COLES|nr:hypothetical protein [Colocasia esculenta]
MWCVSLCLHELWFGIPCEASARSREADSDQVRYQLTGLAEAKISGMADRRDWGGGGDGPEESTQRMIERIWESLTDIRARMDQQAPVPPVAVPPGDGEAIPVAPVPPRVEVPFAAPVPPPPPVLIAEEPVMQGGWTIVERVASLNCARKHRTVVQFPWELAEGSVRARRTFPDRRPVQGRAVAVQGRYLQLCSGSSSSVV